MAASIETKRKLRAIRRLASPVPDQTAEHRLGQIADVLSGKTSVERFINVTSPTLQERLARGQASRAERNAADKRPAVKAEAKSESEEEPKRKRKLLGGHDREERGGFNRSEDLNL